MVVHDFQGVKYVLEGMMDSDIKQPLFCQSCDEMFFGWFAVGGCEESVLDHY